MRNKLFTIGSFIIIYVFTSCLNTSMPKPKDLIPKSKFEKIMIDVYLVQGYNQTGEKPENLKKITQTDLYFSVLKKHNVADTTFINSLIYYSGFIKDFEKMHASIMKKLQENEQQFKPVEKLNTGIE